MGQYDMTNKHGVPLCYYVGCRKHKRLIEAFRGKFCNQHYKYMKELRDKIQPHQGTCEELLCRVVELHVRKQTDIQHRSYVQKLSKILLSSDTQ